MAWKVIKIPGDLYDHIAALAKANGLPIHAALAEYFSGPYMESLEQKQLEECKSCPKLQQAHDEGYQQGRANLIEEAKAKLQQWYDAGIQKGLKMATEQQMKEEAEEVRYQPTPRQKTSDQLEEIVQFKCQMAGLEGSKLDQAWLKRQEDNINRLRQAGL